MCYNIEYTFNNVLLNTIRNYLSKFFLSILHPNKLFIVKLYSKDKL